MLGERDGEVNEQFPTGEQSDETNGKVQSITPLSTGNGGKPRSAVDGDHTSSKTDVKSQPAQTVPTSGTDPANPTSTSSGDLALDALAAARRVARSSPGNRTGGGRRAARRARGAPAGAGEQPRGGYSSAGPDDTDPQLIGGLLAGYVADRGWDKPLAEARVFSDWPGLVGADIATHCAPTGLSAGELKVTAESTAWATQLRLMSSSVLARLVDELGPDVVTRIHVTGPTGPSWKHGGFAVRGARGPRDTYG